MRYGPIKLKDAPGRELVLRSAEERDAETLIEYLKLTAAETRFLIREPDEISITPEAERDFIRANLESENGLMLLAFVDGRHAGNCSLSAVSGRRRMRHRCGVAIALRREFWGAGIGRTMLETVLGLAKELGYEQAELEVVDGNAAALALYENLGFTVCGRLPRNMKYSDGTYADSLFMFRYL